MKLNVVWLVACLVACAGTSGLRMPYNPDGPPVSLDGVQTGIALSEVERVLGPAVQGKPFVFRGGQTRVEAYFDPRKGIFQVCGAHGSTLRQGGLRLVGVGDRRQEVERCLGPEAPCTWIHLCLPAPDFLRPAPGRAFYLDGDCAVQYRDDRVVEVGWFPGLAGATDNQNPRHVRRH